ETTKAPKKLGVFELKDRFSRRGKTRLDAPSAVYSGSHNLLEEPAFSKPYSDESMFGESSSFLTVPAADSKQMDSASGGILRKSIKSPLSPKSSSDLIDLRDDRALAGNAKSQTSLNEARFFGSDVTMNPDEATDSQNSIDTASANWDPSAGFLLHRCHSDTNVSYYSVQQIDEVTGSNHYITRDGRINCETVLRGLYWICNLHNSLRICEYLLKNVFCLIDLCQLTWEKPKRRRKHKPSHYYRHTREESANPATGLNTAVNKRIHGRHNLYSRSKSMAVPGIHLSLNSTAGYAGKTSQARSRGSSVVTHNEVGSAEKLAKVNGGGRLLPFGRNRSRRQPFTDDGADRSADVSSDEENSTSRSFRMHQSRPTFHKSDRYLNVDCPALAQVRFQPRRLSLRQRSFQNRCVGEIPVCGSMRQLPNKLLVVEKRPQRRIRAVRSNMIDDKTPEQSRERRKRATINFSLIMEILVKIIRGLGCSHSHSNEWDGGSRRVATGAGHQGTASAAATSVSTPTTLRRHTHECLLRMFTLNQNLFYYFFSRLIAAAPITELMEFLHGLTSFCLDPVVMNPNRPGFSEKWSYHNSFGQSFTGEGTRGAEGVIIASLMGPLVRRFVRCRRELATQENISLFTEIRHFLTYLKAIHGNTFRRALLCALLCPIRTVTVKTQQPTSLCRPRALSGRNSLWPASASKRPSMIVTSGDLVDAGDTISGGQNKRMLLTQSTIGQTWKPSDQKPSKLVTERKLIDLLALKENLRDFTFLLECLEPGTLPEPQLAASFLDLNAPVLARACLLLECAYFVNRCNRGEWPSWMKMNFPMPMQQVEHNSQITAASQQHIAISISGPTGNSVSDAGDQKVAGARSTTQIQWAAGRLFHSWAEALGIRLMTFLEGCSSTEICLSRDFQSDEDFLDDATVNPNGDSCPYALLVMAVQLLNEITAFLRESHQHIARAQATATTGLSRSALEHFNQWDGGPTGSCLPGPCGRRSHAASSTGASNAATGALKSTKRRLSILMPLFTQYSVASEAKEKCNSVYIELSNVRSEDGDTNSRATDDYETIHPSSATGGHSSRQISFAINENDRQRCNSLQGSLSSLDVQSEAVEKPVRKSIPKSLTRKRQRSGSFRQSFQLSSLMNVPRTAKTESGLRRMSSRASTSGGECQGSGGRDSSQDDGSTAYANHGSRHIQLPNLRPDAPTIYGRRSDSGEGLGVGDFDGDVELNKRSPRRDRRRTSLGAGREPSRSSSSRTHIQAPVADVYSSNMPWMPAVIAFAKKTNFDCKHQPFCEPNCFDRQQQQLRSLVQAIRQVYSAPNESSFIRSVDELPEGRRVRRVVGEAKPPSATDSHPSNGGLSCQCSSDSFGGGVGGGWNEEEFAFSDEENGAAKEGEGGDELEEHFRFTPLLRGGGLGAADLANGFNVGGGGGGGVITDPELETSASILHRVFGGGDSLDKKNTLFSRTAKRKNLTVRIAVEP
uniref:Ras-GAP domain-containing protein n=1 Tax=Mesocestoides corti TaxID=53468 RepID=A0A5K3ERF1_MESCO